MLTYPVCLVGLERRQTIVIGGGKVAARKAQGLLEAGARVRVISPQSCTDFYFLKDHFPGLEIVPRAYQPGDLVGAFVVIAATDSPEVNQAVWEEALAEGCLINVVDDPEHCNMILPAVVERGQVKVAVTTGGSSPALARRLREQLDAWLPPKLGELAWLLAELRPELLARFDPGRPRLEAALMLVDSDLVEFLEQEGYSEARARALELLQKLQEPDE